MNKLISAALLSLMLFGGNAQAGAFETATSLLAEGKKVEALGSALAAIDAASGSSTRAAARILAAQIYIQLGEPIVAEDLLTLALQDKPGDKALELRVKNELGAISTQRGDYAAAVVHYAASLQLARELGRDVRTRQRLLINLAHALLDANETNSVPSVLAELAGNLAGDKLRDPELLIATAVVYRRADRQLVLREPLRMNSLNLLTTAFSIARNMKDDRSASLALGLQGELYMDEARWPEALQLSEVALLYAQQAAALEAEYRWQGQIGAILLAQDKLAASEEAYRTALLILSEVRRDLPVGSPRIFAERVLPVYNGYADVLLRQARQTKDLTAARRILGTVVDTLEELKKAEVEDYFAKECVVEGNQDRSLLLSGVAIVYPVFLDDRTEIILETEQGYSQHVIAVGRAQMTNVIRRFRLELENWNVDDANYLQTGKLLEGWLIDPLEQTLAQMNVKTLVFVPDGPLRTIPMAALYDGKAFLIERYALASTPAISLTKASLQQQQQAALIGGITEAVQGYTALSFVDPELDEVSSILKHPKMKDRTFMLAQVENRFETNQYSVVHFATHGTFSSDFRKSYILTYDDKLTMGRLEQVLGDQAGLDMLVLSACETAAGDDRAALGLAGVAIQAGASSALASLWLISDEGTAALIPQFYKGIYDQGLSKAMSLQQAQIKLLRDPRFNHPVFWAPYLLIGSWI